jgi:hypothetical protein
MKKPRYTLLWSNANGSWICVKNWRKDMTAREFLFSDYCMFPNVDFLYLTD